MDTRNDTTPAGHGILVAASAGLLLAVGLHGIDHALQDRGVGGLSTEVFIGGTVNAVLAVLAFALALRGHRHAPVIAAGVGAYLAIGVTAAHFAPRWGAVSDPYSELSLGFLSWAAAGFEVACAAALAAVGVAVLRRRQTTGRLASR